MLNTAWAVAIVIAVQSQTTGPAAPAAPVWSDDRPITRLFQNLGKDVIALPSVDAAIGLGLGAGVTMGLHTVDPDVTDWAGEAGSSSYTDIGRVLGDAWIQGGGAIFTYAVGRIHHNAEATHIGSDLIRAQALNAVLTVGVKAAVDRTRPNGGRHAFPSGHTSAVFASAAVLERHYGWRAGLPAYAFAGFIGWTRVRDRSHWLSDIAFGGTVGVIAGRTVTRHRPTSWMLAPSVTKESRAVFLIRTW